MTSAFEPRRGLLTVQAHLTGPAEEVTGRLLLDTGAAFTMIDPVLLDGIGCDLTKPSAHVRIASVSRIELVYLLLPMYVVYLALTSCEEGGSRSTSATGSSS